MHLHKKSSLIALYFSVPTNLGPGHGQGPTLLPTLVARRVPGLWVPGQGQDRCRPVGVGGQGQDNCRACGLQARTGAGTGPVGVGGLWAASRGGRAAVSWPV